jgi:hypothetical protein
MIRSGAHQLNFGSSLPAALMVCRNHYSEENSSPQDQRGTRATPKARTATADHRQL